MRIWNLVCIFLNFNSMVKTSGVTKGKLNVTKYREPYIDLTLRKAVVVRCDNTSTKDIVDMVLDYKNATLYETHCNVNDRMIINPLVIPIIPTNQVGSVSIISVSTMDRKSTSNMDYFDVKLQANNSRSLIQCGSYTKTFEVTEPNLVRCKLQSATISSVVISPMSKFKNSSSQLIPIVEVSVFSKEYTHGVEGYYGCYKRFGMNGSITRIDKENDYSCSETCYKNNYIFATTRPSGSCLCGNTLPTIILPVKQCLPYCGKTLCGGKFRVPIYIARAPQIHVLACNKIEFNHTNYYGKMDPVKCIQLCGTKEFEFAYVHKSRRCECQKQLIGYEISMDVCDMRCLDKNRLAFCEGNNAYLVYTGYTWKENHALITDIYRCIKDDMDETGRCEDECEEGFKGMWCLERDEHMPHLNETFESLSPVSRTRTPSLISTNITASSNLSGNSRVISMTTDDEEDYMETKNIVTDHGVDTTTNVEVANNEISSGYLWIISIVGGVVGLFILIVAFVVMMKKFGKTEEGSDEE